MVRRRLDAELVRRGLVAAPEQARAALAAGRVTVGGSIVVNARSLVAPGEAVAVESNGRPFVSRGGEKLAAALDRFGVDPAGRDAMDAGASTGGFSDCLLQRGVARLIAVDVGYGEFAWDLRRDPRVTVLERTNVRDLAPGLLPFAPDLVVADLSFISLRTALPPLAGVATQEAEFVVLVKPQFEAGRREIEPGGVVRDGDVWRRAINDVVEVAGGLNLRPAGVTASPLPGPAGNVEFPLHLVRVPVPCEPDLALALDRAIGLGEEIGGRA